MLPLSGELGMNRSLSIFVLASIITTVLPAAAKAQKTTPDIRFPEESQVQEKPAPHRSTATTWSDPPLLRPESPDPGAVGPSRSSIADQLNRAELNRLLAVGRALRRAPVR
jgi:hypothetical protein